MEDNFKSLGDALSDFSGQRKYKNNVNEVRIVAFWQELMGDLVHKYTEKIFYKNKSASLKRERMYFLEVQTYKNGLLMC